MIATLKIFFFFAFLRGLHIQLIQNDFKQFKENLKRYEGRVYACLSQQEIIWSSERLLAWSHVFMTVLQYRCRAKEYIAKNVIHISAI